jgi:hypothetical protein
MIDARATALEVSVSTNRNAAFMRAVYDAYTAGDLGSLSERALDSFAFHFRGVARSPASTTACRM